MALVLARMELAGFRMTPTPIVRDRRDMRAKLQALEAEGQQLISCKLDWASAKDIGYARAGFPSNAHQPRPWHLQSSRLAALETPPTHLTVLACPLLLCNSRVLFDELRLGEHDTRKLRRKRPAAKGGGKKTKGGAARKQACIWDTSSCSLRLLLKEHPLPYASAESNAHLTFTKGQSDSPLCWCFSADVASASFGSLSYAAA